MGGQLCSEILTIRPNLILSRLELRFVLIRRDRSVLFDEGPIFAELHGTFGGVFSYIAGLGQPCVLSVCV